MSAVIQFVNHGIRLENCTLGAWFPPLEYALHKIWRIDPGTSHLNVYLLDPSTPLLLSNVAPLPPTISTRSGRHLLGYLQVNAGGASTTMKSFHCSSRSVTTLEIGCPENTSCAVSFVQDYVSPKIGSWL